MIAVDYVDSLRLSHIVAITTINKDITATMMYRLRVVDTKNLTPYHCPANNSIRGNSILDID